MVNVIYSFKVAPGKVEQAVEWSRKHMEFLKKSGLTKPGTTVLRKRTGEWNDLIWVDQLPSLAAYEEGTKVAEADSGWVASVKVMIESDWYLGHTCNIYDVLEVV